MLRASTCRAASASQSPVGCTAGGGKPLGLVPGPGLGAATGVVLLRSVPRARGGLRVALSLQGGRRSLLRVRVGVGLTEVAKLGRLVLLRCGEKEAVGEGSGRLRVGAARGRLRHGGSLGLRVVGAGLLLRRWCGRPQLDGPSAVPAVAAGAPAAALAIGTITAGRALCTPSPAAAPAAAVAAAAAAVTASSSS